LSSSSWVELKGRVTVVTQARGKPAPDFVFANARDYGYFLLLLDSLSLRSLESGAFYRVEDPFLRAMLWGTLWDQVRNFRMESEQFGWLARNELAAESDEQIITFVLARVERALLAYIRPGADDRIQSEVEQLVWTGAVDYRKPYGVGRHTWTRSLLSPDHPTRSLRGLGLYRQIRRRRADQGSHPVGHRHRPARARRTRGRTTPGRANRGDTTPDGRRRAFIAQAARPNAETKRDYFSRYFADSTLKRTGPRAASPRSIPSSTRRSPCRTSA
jgi:aminopeptidase N